MVFIDQLIQIIIIISPLYTYLLLCSFINPPLNQTPNHGEQRWGINYEHFSHGFGIVILAYFRCLFQKSGCLFVPHRAHWEATHVHHCHSWLNLAIIEGTAAVKSQFQKLLKWVVILLPHFFYRNCFKNSIYVYLSAPIYIKRTTLFITSKIGPGISFHHSFFFRKIEVL